LPGRAALRLIKPRHVHKQPEGRSFITGRVPRQHKAQGRGRAAPRPLGPRHFMPLGAPDVEGGAEPRIHQSTHDAPLQAL